MGVPENRRQIAKEDMKMDHFEMVEKLRQKANVTYEEAKDALESSDWDILDALVLLESEGKVKSAQQEYSTQEKEESKFYVEVTKPQASEGLSKAWAWIKRMFQKGNANQFVIRRHGEELISMPITVLVLLMICFWPFSLIVLFVGLFLGARYSFQGPDVRGGNKVNEAMDKAAQMVQKDEENKDA